MSNVMKMEYPVNLLVYPARLATDQISATYLLTDEYVFATYMSAMLQGFRFDVNPTSSDHLGEIISDCIPGFDPEDLGAEGLDHDKLMQIVNNLRNQFNEHISSTYVKDFFLSISIYRSLMKNRDIRQETMDIFRNLVGKIVEYNAEQTKNVTTSLSMNLNRLGETIDLTLPEARLIELNLLFSIDARCAIFRDFLFNVTKNTSTFEHFYKVMLGNDLPRNQAVEVDEAFSERSKPIALGIVSYDTKTKRLSNASEFWVYALTSFADTDEKFFSRFVEKMSTKKSFSGAIAKAGVYDEEVLDEFLNRSHRIMDDQSCNTGTAEEAAGLNVMIYGSRRLDKMGYVAQKLEALEMNGMRVRTRDAKSMDIPSICYVAQKHIETLDSTYILVIDNAESALTKQNRRPAWYLDMMGEASLDGKKSDDLESDELLLIKNPIPSIWLVTSPSMITPENVGRFLFHIELKGGSRKDRRDEVEKVVGELGYPIEIAQQLSKYFELNVEQIKSAGRLVDMMSLADPKRQETLIKLIGNSQKALDRDKMEEMRDSVTKYSLDLLNISGTMSPDKIIQALKRRPMGSLCFYGLPGTGKTQLAEYIAVQLDKPLIIKPASELLNMYLGETEKNIAKMFDEARAEDAILLLDEADSFLRDRAMAQKSWEITQVNELLQKMERYPGIFICATNLFQSLDAAALRRFTFKMEFHALTPNQRIQMLVNETGIVLDEMSDADRESLIMDMALIRHLTPGDFATVRRQSNLLGETLTVKQWMRQLEIEAKAKLVGVQRNTYLTEDEIHGGEVEVKRRSN